MAKTVELTERELMIIQMSLETRFDLLEEQKKDEAYEYWDLIKKIHEVRHSKER